MNKFQSWLSFKQDHKRARISLRGRFMALLAAILVASIPQLAHADPADIGATSRSVVRIALVAKDGDKLFFVGHGSGFAVAPDKIVTNAHVIELARKDRSIIIGIIPSEGSKSYGGRILSVSPGNDLALLQVEDGGRFPPTTIYTGSVNDGANVIALGYPGAVDRAQGLQLDDMTRPMSPVKTRGDVSGGRTSRQFDTILHTAPIASGNSGGPLVDNCGRILGANSFGSLSDGNDAEFGFAVSNRELLDFLRKANIKPQIATGRCRSVAELSRQEEAREASARAQVEAAARIEQDKLSKAEDKARIDAHNSIISERENAMALAALMLFFSILAFQGAGILFMRDQRTQAIGASAGGGVLLLLAILTFFLRPSFADVEDRVKEKLTEQKIATAADKINPEGGYFCRINLQRSRITVSQVRDIPFEWKSGGCVNDRTQYGRDGAKWSRIFVPNEEATISVNSFDPDRRIFSVERYLLGIAPMGNAREIRGRYEIDKCTGDSDTVARLEDMQKAIKEALPKQPNERLVYECEKAE